MLEHVDSFSIQTFFGEKVYWVGLFLSNYHYYQSERLPVTPQLQLMVFIINVWWKPVKSNNTEIKIHTINLRFQQLNHCFLFQ